MHSSSAGATLGPAREEAHFRLASTDYAAHVLDLALGRKFLVARPSVSFDFSPVDDGVFDAMERDEIGLLLYADDS